eukprot:m.393750 g.393750  ORF g.393750 m.393750 type:complete len:94 (+) comp28333_c0_seq2:689-970(+)
MLCVPPLPLERAREAHCMLDGCLPRMQSCRRLSAHSLLPTTAVKLGVHRMRLAAVWAGVLSLAPCPVRHCLGQENGLSMAFMAIRSRPLCCTA